MTQSILVVEMGKVLHSHTARAMASLTRCRSTIGTSGITKSEVMVRCNAPMNHTPHGSAHEIIMGWFLKAQVSS